MLLRDAAFLAVLKFLDVIPDYQAGDRLAPVDLYGKLQKRFTLIGVQGIVRMAMSGFDVACWDALAQSANLPLASLIGGAPKKIPAYNSCGLSLAPPKALADEAAKLAKNFHAVKLRLGYPTVQEDIAALHAVRKRLGGDFTIMVDYNQALTVAEALKRGRALDDEGGIVWLEEPIRHDDYAGNAKLALAESNHSDRREFFPRTAMAAAYATSAPPIKVVPDLGVGGVTGWCARARFSLHTVSKVVATSISK